MEEFKDNYNKFDKKSGGVSRTTNRRKQAACWSKEKKNKYEESKEHGKNI